MTIEVTAEDIAKGERLVRNNCPVARAICRHLPFTQVTYRYYWPCGSYDPYPLPESVILKIRRFDDYGDMEPFTFELDPPEQL